MWLVSKDALTVGDVVRTKGERVRCVGAGNARDEGKACEAKR